MKVWGRIEKRKAKRIVRIGFDLAWE